MSEATPYPTYESPIHPMTGLESKSATARRGIAVWTMETEVTTAARRAGWTIHRRRQVGNSIYSWMRLSRKRELCIRFSDHAPGKPFDPSEMTCPVMLCTLGTAGAVGHATRYVEEAAFEYASANVAKGEAVAA